jgi:Amt family ammonium transporter
VTGFGVNELVSGKASPAVTGDVAVAGQNPAAAPAEPATAPAATAPAAAAPAADAKAAAATGTAPSPSAATPP